MKALLIVAFWPFLFGQHIDRQPVDETQPYETVEQFWAGFTQGGGDSSSGSAE